MVANVGKQGRRRVEGEEPKFYKLYGEMGGNTDAVAMCHRATQLNYSLSLTRRA
jgi:hypothetical protein